jgi:hypothetical protein
LTLRFGFSIALGDLVYLDRDWYITHAGLVRSWISGISEVALVVFVRKHAPEIQYLRATISEEQRQEFGRLVETTIRQIEAGHFDSHSGIRFPQNGCVSCSHLGLCLKNEQLVAAKLIRKPGASDLDWLDELVD